MTVVTDSMIEVADAAAAFERRWTLGALLAVDPELHARFTGQQDDWHEALVAGSAAEVREQTAAMCRAWAAATKRMEGQLDDAYMLGICPRTGLRVAITRQKAAVGRVQELGEGPVVLLSPDEAATLLAAQQAVVSLKSVFPGAELVELRPAECAT